MTGEVRGLGSSSKFGVYERNKGSKLDGKES